MPQTVPNQKIIHINRESFDGKQFLGILKENWYAANKDLSPYGLVLYLYIAGNADGYNLALSQVAAEEAGITKTTYHKYLNELINKGYLVQRSGNVYDFYEVPKGKCKNAFPPCELESLLDEQDSLQDEISHLRRNREINNTDNPTDKKIKKEFVF
ncbi:MAG: hypothetical protein KIG65_05730 [Eubacteriales bacterium]|nr:hypothetical protein [Eubacteriales bacterium]